MDPNETLKAIRKLLSIQLGDNGRPLSFDETDRLCNLFDSLDTWLKRGGFLPKQWQKD